MIMRENERLTVARYLSYPLRSRLSNNSFLNEAPRDSPPRFRESISSPLSVSLSGVSRRVNTHSLRHLCRILRVFQRARFPSAWNDPLELSPRPEMDGMESGNDRASTGVKSYGEGRQERGVVSINCLPPYFVHFNILHSIRILDVGSNLRGVWCFYFIKVNAFSKFRD